MNIHDKKEVESVTLQERLRQMASIAITHPQFTDYVNNALEAALEAADALDQKDAEIERLTAEVTKKDAVLNKMAEWDCDCEYGDYGSIVGGRCPSCLCSEVLGRLQGSESSDCNPVSAGLARKSSGPALVEITAAKSVAGTNTDSDKHEIGPPEGFGSNRSKVPQAGEYGSGDSGGPTDSDEQELGPFERARLRADDDLAGFTDANRQEQDDD